MKHERTPRRGSYGLPELDPLLGTGDYIEKDSI